MAKVSLENKNKIEGYTLPDIQTCYEATIIDKYNTVAVAKTGQLTSGRIWSVQKQTYIYKVTRFVTKVILWCCRKG